MQITHLWLQNWRNFKKVDINLGSRAFFVGPNASGKSNLLDALKFLSEVANPEGGGLRKAVNLQRGGLSKIRCLAATQPSDVQIHVTLTSLDGSAWDYELSLTQQQRGAEVVPVVKYERVKKNGRKVIEPRPNDDDKKDTLLLTETYLESPRTNQKFRDVQRALSRVRYLHVIPHIIRNRKLFNKDEREVDNYGYRLIEDMALAAKKDRRSRFRKIEELLKQAVPQLKDLGTVRDELGISHLEAWYEHWRPRSAKQNEMEFSDGTLRFIGLLWSLLDDSSSVILFEEPELSLHPAIVRYIPRIVHKLTQKSGKQVFMTTHSLDLLDDDGIQTDEVFLLEPGDATSIQPIGELRDVKVLMESGETIGRSLYPRSRPRSIHQGSLTKWLQDA